MQYTDPHLLQAFDAAQLTHQQRSLLQGVLRALNPDAYLGEHVAAANSALLALTRAHDALAGHGAEGQPRWDLLQRVVGTTAASVTAALPVHRVNGGAQQLLAAQQLLSAIDGVLAQQKDKTPRTHTEQAAGQLDLLLAPLAAAVRGWVHPLWNGSISNLSSVDRMSAELAVVVALEGRDGLALRIDLMRLLTSGTPAASAVAALLWPPRYRHVLTLLVQGARDLRRLDDLLTGARQWPMFGDDPTAHVPKTKYLHEFATSLGPMDGSSVLVQLPVEAADVQTAVVYGRRKLGEVLDQYAAGERLVDLSIAPSWLVVGPTGKATRGSVRSGTTRIAFPLTPYWPTALGPALRAAHLARQVDAPMASAGLAWSALESTGIKAKQVGLLAKACALQTMRQHLVSLYTVVTVTAKAGLTHQRWRVEGARAQLKLHENALRGCAQATTAGARKAFTEHTGYAEQARHRVEEEAQACKHAEVRVLTLLSALQAQVPTVGPKEYLQALDTWVEVLLPDRATSSRTLADARAAVDALGVYAGGRATDLLALWRGRLADPVALADWLQDQEDVYRAILEWLYVTRNLAFHRGRFTGPADVLTAHAGRGITDMALEFLGNWRSVERARAASGTPAVEVYQRLADRKDALDARLRKAASCHPLRVDHISGPDEDWWTEP